MFTKEAQELAKPCYEAIKKIAERQKRECPECKDSIMGINFVRSGDGWVNPCKVCNGTGKVKGKWEWEPEVGEWVLVKDFSPPEQLIVSEFNDRLWTVYYVREEGLGCHWITGDIIPVLHWERIEEILDSLGYYLSLAPEIAFRSKSQVKKLTDKLKEKGMGSWWFSEYAKIATYGKGKSRQEAVMQAVIELGKEV